MVVSEDALAALESLYGELDREISNAGASCSACGACCNFRTNGFRLYALTLETELIRARTGSDISLRPDGTCIALVDNRCAIHSVRPLGCRTQFCEQTHQDLYEDVHRRIRTIESKEAIPYDFAPVLVDQG